MRLQAIVHEGHSPVWGWMSQKSMRAAALVGAVLILSLAINVSIILLAGTTPIPTY